jgi:hypothetical protein
LLISLRSSAVESTRARWTSVLSVSVQVRASLRLRWTNSDRSAFSFSA